MARSRSRRRSRARCWERRTCCSGSTRTCRTTCRSCSRSSGSATGQGESRKPDHDKANANLSLGYEPVVSAVGARYDAAMSLTNPAGLFLEDVAGLELVRQWREQVWRNAERLVNAKDDAERARVAANIQAYAAPVGEHDRRRRRCPGCAPSATEYCHAAARDSGFVEPFSVRPACEHLFVPTDDPNHKGNVAELKIAAEAARLGIAVLRADDRARALRPRLRDRRRAPADPVQVGVAQRRRDHRPRW